MSFFSVLKVRFINIEIFLFLFLLLCRFLSPTLGLFSMVVILLMVFLSREKMILSLFLTWLFSLLNPIIFPDVPAAAMLKYMTVILAGVVLFFRSVIDGSALRISYLSFITLILGLIIIFHSVYISYMVDVSLLKSISWLITILTLISLWSGMPKIDKDVLFNKIENIILVFILLSLPTILFPSIGFAKNDTGFQGLFNHPQVFGPTIALLGVMTGGRILSSNKPFFIDFLLLIFFVVMIFLSEARTAGGAFVLALVLAIFLSPYFSNKKILQINPGLKSKITIYCLFVSIVSIPFLYPAISEPVEKYIFKREEADNLIDAASSSRGALVQRMTQNIDNNPYFGIGFGVASDPNDFEIQRDPYFNLPVSANIEKGVLPIAVLEELGLIIGSMVFIWIFYLLKIAARTSVKNFAMVIVVFMINLGEYMFFSIGGMGLIMIIIITYSVSSHRKNGY